jgi:hypothetical protein
MKRLRRFVWSNVGHCMRCIRLAFQAAALVCVAFALSAALSRGSIVTGLTGLVAVGAVSLWLIHIFAFAVKSLERQKRIHAPGTAAEFSRRHTLAAFVKVLTGVVLVSATPALAQTCPDGRPPCFAGTCCDADHYCCCSAEDAYCESNDNGCICDGNRRRRN